MTESPTARGRDTKWIVGLVRARRARAARVGAVSPTGGQHGEGMGHCERTRRRQLHRPSRARPRWRPVGGPVLRRFVDQQRAVQVIPQGKTTGRRPGAQCVGHVRPGALPCLADAHEPVGREACHDAAPSAGDSPGSSRPGFGRTGLGAARTACSLKLLRTDSRGHYAVTLLLF